MSLPKPVAEIRPVGQASGAVTDLFRRLTSPQMLFFCCMSIPKLVRKSAITSLIPK